MIEQLQEGFKDIWYNDAQHKYHHIKGWETTELQSVTKFLSNLKPEFNNEFWPIIKAYQFSGYDVKSSWNNVTSFRLFEPDLMEFREVSIYDDHSHLTVTPEDVKHQWHMDSTIGKTRGTYIHNYLERLEDRKTDIPKTELIEGMSTAEAVNYVNSIKTAQELCLEYVKYAKENLILIVSEFPVGDLKLGLAGTFDRLYFNKQTKQYEIWDFKTDKQIRYKSSFGKLKLFNLPDCEFEKYSLQTSLYKKIIEDNLNIKLGESRIVWFNLKEKKYEIITCTDYVNKITTLKNNGELSIF